MTENNYRKHFSSIEEYEEAKSYWFDKLSGDIDGIRLQSDSIEISDQKKSIYKIAFNSELSANLLRVSKNQDGSLYVLLLSALKSLLYKYTDQNDVVVCSPIYNYEEGMDSDNKYILLRDSLNEEMTFKELLMNVMKTVSDGYKHQYYPMDRLFKLLGLDPEKKMTLSVALALENIHNKKLVQWIADSEVNDFTILVIRNEDKLEGSIIYKTNRFKEDTIQKFAERFFYILTQALDNLGIKLTDVTLVTSAEKEKILNDFNNTGTDYPKDKTIQQLFEEQVKQSPDNIAVVFKDKQLTYRELNEKANRLAGVLRGKGVKPDSIVGLMVERSVEMVVGILGILKAGGAYLPLDLNYPEERIKYMLHDCGAKILLTQGDVKDSAGKVGFESEIIDLNDPEIYKGECINPVAINKPEDTAYIIYTSGSTGRPKGVMVAHTGIANLKVFFKKELNIDSDDRIIQFASYSFDASVWETFMALLLGASLYILSKEVTENTDKFENYINDNKITIATLPPPYLANVDKERVKSLRKLITAGSEINLNLYAKWKDKAEYINAYGPTETTICATVWKDIDNRAELKTIPIGKPITNTKAYIVNKNNQLQPIGVPGELCISGITVAKGYLNKPELTTEKFTVNPFTPEERMYRTGDLVRWLPDGNIEFLGRIDHQVKIRGYRIEVGEIESALLNYKNLREAVVTAKEVQNGDKHLCAYIMADEEIPASALREYLSAKLPDYMIPSYFVQLEKMPLTTNGKIDRKALPKPDSSIKTGLEYEAPRNVYEEILVRTWEEVLKVNNIGINDDFFELGGDSLKAIVIVNKINAEFMTGFSSKNLFELKTIKEISKSIQQNYFYTVKNKGCTVFHEDKSKVLIFFPPIVGYGSAYEALANYMKDYKLFCYDFIETDTFIEDYVSEIVKIQNANEYEYIFAGYSAGGGLAFEVAARMAKEGYRVSDLILIGTTIPGTESVEAMVEEENKIIEIQRDWAIKNMPDHIDDFNEMIVAKTKKYFQYCKKQLNLEKTNSNIHFIVSSEDEDSIDVKRINRYENASEWSKLTNGEFCIYLGQGKHSVMISEEYAEKNAKVIMDILDKIYESKQLNVGG